MNEAITEIVRLIAKTAVSRYLQRRKYSDARIQAQPYEKEEMGEKPSKKTRSHSP